MSQIFAPPLDILTVLMVLWFGSLPCQKSSVSHIQMYHSFLLLNLEFESQSEHLSLHPCYREIHSGFPAVLLWFHFLYLGLRVHLEFILVYSVRNTSNFLFFQGTSRQPRHNALKSWSAPMVWDATFINTKFLDAVGSVSGLCIQFHHNFVHTTIPH